jgi:adenylate cyclase
VKGRAAPVAIHEPLPETQGEYAAPYAQALALYRSRDFSGAKSVLSPVASRDPAAASFLARIDATLADPPDGAWDAVTTLDGK